LFSDGADPWLHYFNGNYYLVTTTWSSQLVMRKSPTLAGLALAEPVYIWSATDAGACCNFWAFEFHRLMGPNGMRWYLMFTAGHEANLDRQHLQVLESEGDDPMGPYAYKGAPMPNTWNIDGTYLQHNGKLYVLWSEWEGDLQKNWIREMTNPWTVTGQRVELTAPLLPWERQSGLDNPGLVTEAPEVLQRDGRTFVIYSASSCNGPDYKLGMIELVGTDPLQTSSWRKFPDPVFQRGNGVFGPGHNGFFKSPDGTEDWLVYHGNSRADQGCGNTRSVRAQKFTWNNGLPVFGAPAAAGTPQAVPSGEKGPLTVKVSGPAMQLINNNSGLCLSAGNGSVAEQQACTGQNSQWVLDATADGFYRLSNTQSGLFLGISDCDSNDGATAVNEPWRDTDCQKWRVQPASQGGWLELINARSNKTLEVGNCATAAGSAINQWSRLDNTCQRWRLQPVDQVAIISGQSGKALDIANCALTQGLSVTQWQWLSSPCQKFTFNHTGEGLYQIKPVHNQSACLSRTGNDVIQDTCSGAAANWRLEPQGDGAMAFFAPGEDRALDLSDCGLDNGTNIGVWEWLDNVCQRFYLRSVIPSPLGNMPGGDGDGAQWNLTGNLGTHDPAIVEENGVWWEFQTGLGIYGKRSADGLHWEPLPSIFANKLNWWANFVPNQESRDVWAPDIQHFNGRAWMYYSISTFGSRQSAIGLASASSIAAGDWRDEGLVINTTTASDYNAIDPNVFIDPQGAPWMVLGSWSSGIKLTRIDPNTMKPTGQLYSLARRDGGIEAPTLAYRNGYYYLFVSIGTCCAGVDSTYRIMVGRSQQITGPYLDKNGVNMMQGGVSLVKGNDGRWIGPGGQDIHIYDGKHIIAYHVYDRDNNGAAVLRIATLGWDTQGWPFLQ
jgi:GH43 family beta-xylosidase